MMFIFVFQNETAEENQRKLSLEMQKIREEMGKNKSFDQITLSNVQLLH